MCVFFNSGYAVDLDITIIFMLWQCAMVCGVESVCCLLIDGRNCLKLFVWE